MKNKKNKNKKKGYNKWLILGLIGIVGLLIAVPVIKGKSKPKGLKITVEDTQKRTIKETVSASGKIFPESEVKISSDVSGEIVKLLVEEGDSVTVGKLLAKIDPEAYFSAVERGEAGLNGAKATYANSMASISSSRAQKEQIIAQLDNAVTINNRNSGLYKDGVISLADYETSQSTVLQLEANLRASEANIVSAEKSADGAKFQVKSSSANLKELKTNLGRTSIKSPTNGIVSSLSVEQGERVVGTIQMAGTEMMRIANLNSMEVQVDVSENDILRVSKGDMVDIEVDAYLDKIFKGRVTEIANSASNISSQGALNTDQVTNFVVKIRIIAESYREVLADNQKFPFRPGMSASVDIFTNEVSDILSIPIQCVTVREKESDDSKEEKELEEVVFVMSGDTVKMITVTTGIQDDEYIEIKTGLEVDEKVVTGPYSAVSKKLKDGKKVQLKKKKEEIEKEEIES